MNSNVTKRTLSAGLGVGALALLAPRASADTPFSSFAFPATGAPTARTLPDRLGELKNVKDFGARGDGSTNDTAAIQAAINQAGTTYFPPGDYRVTRPITFRGDQAVTVIGTRYSSVSGDFDGYVFDRFQWGGDLHLSAQFRDLHILNAHPSPRAGCIRIAGGIVVGVEKVFTEANRGITIQSTYGGYIRDVVCLPHPNNLQIALRGGTNASAGFLPGSSIGIYLEITNTMVVEDIDIHGLGDGVRVAQGGARVSNGRIEQCIRAVTAGVDENGDDSSTGIVIDSMTMEANNYHIYLNACQGGYIRNVGILGDPFSALENVPGVVGIYCKRAQRMTWEGILVEGAFQDGWIKFDPPPPALDAGNFNLAFTNVTAISDHQVDMTKYPNAQVWKGVNTLPPNSAIFTFCNQTAVAP